MTDSSPAQHAGISSERWAQFSPDQRLLMIANELHRASRCLQRGERKSLAASYERALRLADLTAGLAGRPALRRELLRWRDLLAAQYLDGGDPAGHRVLLAALLSLSPTTNAQRPYLLGSPNVDRGTTQAESP